MAVLEVKFKRMLFSPNWPSRKDIRATFMKGDETKAIWERHDSEDHRERCIDKIKSMYKAVRKIKKRKPK